MTRSTNPKKQKISASRRIDHFECFTKSECTNHDECAFVKSNKTNVSILIKKTRYLVCDAASVHLCRGPTSSATCMRASYSARCNTIVAVLRCASCVCVSSHHRLTLGFVRSLDSLRMQYILFCVSFVTCRLEHNTCTSSCKTFSQALVLYIYLHGIESHHHFYAICSYCCLVQSTPYLHVFARRNGLTRRTGAAQNERHRIDAEEQKNAFE